MDDYSGEEYEVAMREWSDWVDEIEAREDARVLVPGDGETADYTVGNRRDDSQYVDAMFEESDSYYVAEHDGAFFGRAYEVMDSARNFSRVLNDPQSAATDSDRKFCEVGLEHAADIMYNCFPVFSYREIEQQFKSGNFDTMSRVMERNRQRCGIAYKDGRFEYDERYKLEHDESLERYPFDERLGLCVKHGLPWTALRNEQLNADIRLGFATLNRVEFRDSPTYDWMLGTAQSVEALRERDGINGDEPGLSPEMAEMYGHGKPIEDMYAEAEAHRPEPDASKMTMNRERELQKAAFFERVYQMAQVKWEGVPSETRDHPDSVPLSIEPETYKRLGPEYRDFCAAKASQRVKEQATVVSKTSRRMPKGAEELLEADAQMDSDGHRFDLGGN